jgi:four helix bundle protein
MSDIADEMKQRTMRFALDVCALIQQLPDSEPGPTVRRQLAKSSTGLAINYRASCRARSHAEFTAKTGLVAEEADESQGWLEFIDASRLIASVEVVLDYPTTRLPNYSITQLLNPRIRMR